MSLMTSESLHHILVEFGQDIAEYPTFIETGTLNGDTIRTMHGFFAEVHTIEISKQYYNAFLTNHPKYNNVTIHLGDSSKVLPDLLNDISDNTIFWLDGHWSSGDTGRGEKDCPLLDELAAIDTVYSPQKALIIVDDHQQFGTHLNEDWSDITEENVLASFLTHEVATQKVMGSRYVLLVHKR